MPQSLPLRPDQHASSSATHGPNAATLDWNDIDTVLLDMDGTLLDLHFDNYFWLEHLPKRYAEHHNLDYTTAREKLHSHIKETEGTLQWYCLDHWSEVVKMDIPLLKREISEKIQMRQHTQAFLMFLKAQKKQVILVTNAHRDGLEIKLEKADLRPWLDEIVSSHDYQIPKESPVFWESLQKAHPFEPEKALFIDDTPRIIAQAQAQGIKHLVCITHPDSQKPPRAACDQPCLYIRDFDEILPI